jgi:hypothetical protein
LPYTFRGKSLITAEKTPKFLDGIHKLMNDGASIPIAAEDKATGYLSPFRPALSGAASPAHASRQGYQGEILARSGLINQQVVEMPRMRPAIEAGLMVFSKPQIHI